MEDRRTEAEMDLESILGQLSEGKTLYICSYTRAMRIRQRDIDKWARAGRPLLKQQGKSLYVGQGKKYVCIDFCQLRFADGNGNFLAHTIDT